MVVIRNFSFSLFPTIITLLAFVTMCKLGFWQLDRAEQKEQELLSFSQQEYVNIEELAQIATKNAAELHGRNIKFQGKINLSKVWLVDNRTHQGKVGYSVVVAVMSDKSESPILVDIGWVKSAKYREQLPQIDLPERVFVGGIIKSNSFEQFTLSNAPITSKRIQSYQQIFASEPNEYLPLVVFSQTNTIDGMPQLYKPVVMPPEKHVAYAVQWFLLAAASVIVFLFASRKKTVRGNNSNNKNNKQE